MVPNTYCMSKGMLVAGTGSEAARLGSRTMACIGVAAEYY